MSDKCNIEGCNRDCFQDSNQCILHCEKHAYQFDIDNSVLSKFYNELIEYIVDIVLVANGLYTGHENFQKYLLTGNDPETFDSYFKEPEIDFNFIFFPYREESINFDYLFVLNKLGNIHFNYCKFAATSLDMPEAKVFYQDCTFLNLWHLTNSVIIDNTDYVAYQSCSFKEKVVGKLDDNVNLKNCLFKDCIFHKELSFKNMTFSKKIFNNTDYYEASIEALKIEQCVIQEDFILNNLNSGSVLIIDTEFKSKFEMKDSHINMMFEAINTNFLGLFDVQFSNFAGFECFKCVFSNVASFEQCTFSVEDRHKEYMAIFKYTTFLSFASFRNSIFNLGIDLENANLKEAPNFLNIELLSDNTNRETLRIIKNSFDKIGNHINANDFFVKEMKKYKQELSQKKGNKQEKILLWFNEKASDFGQSYAKPIIWIFLIGIFYSGLIYTQENGYLDCVYKISPPLLNMGISAVVEFFNAIAKNIIPFKSFAKEGMEFLSLIFYIMFASLTWQTIVAFKRHTKR